MAWEVHSAPQDGYTLWRDRDRGFWRVTRDYQGRPKDPSNDVNHPRTQRCALESWRAGKSMAALRRNPGRPPISADPAVISQREYRRKRRAGGFDQ
jgi:hypothetical protein